MNRQHNSNSLSIRATHTQVMSNILHLETIEDIRESLQCDKLPYADIFGPDEHISNCIPT